MSHKETPLPPCGKLPIWGLCLSPVTRSQIVFFSGATQHIVDAYFTALYRALASSRTRLLDHRQRNPTVGRTPLNKWSVRRRDLYLTKHNTHNRQTSMPCVGFFYLIFINPIVIHRVRQCTQQGKQVVSTWVYIRCPQVGGCDVQKGSSRTS